MELPEAERFELVCVNPTFIQGPGFTEHIGAGFTSAEFIADFLTGKKVVERRKMALVDVRACAQAHLNAIKFPEARNQRFMLINGMYSFKEMSDALAAEFVP